jgi:hypothetical protein
LAADQSSSATRRRKVKVAKDERARWHEARADRCPHAGSSPDVRHRAAGRDVRLCRLLPGLHDAFRTIIVRPQSFQ